MDYSLTHLYEAVEANDISKVESILSDGTSHLDLNQMVDDHGMTVLHLAVGLNSPEIVSILLINNADPNSAACEDGVTPLHLSVIYNRSDILKLLLRAGGNPLVKDIDGKTCYTMIQENGLENLLGELETSVSDYVDKNVPCKIHAASRSDDELTTAVPRSENSEPLLPSNEDWRNSSLIKSEINPGTDSSRGTTFQSCFTSLEDSYVPTVLENNKVGVHDESKDESRLIVAQDAIQELNSLTSPNATGISNQNTYTFLKDANVDTLCASFSKLEPFPISSSKQSSFEIINSTEACLRDSMTETIWSVSVVGSSTNESQPSKSDLQSTVELETLKIAATAFKIPVTPTTAKVLSKFVDKETKTLNLSSPRSSSTCGYSMELDQGIRKLDRIKQWRELQVQFVQENLSTKNNSTKCYFNYLLLDPYIIKRTNFSGNHLKTGLLEDQDKFDTFLKSIFYIGKGCGTRPLQHLVEAKSRLLLKENKRTEEDNSKLDKVLSIWKQGQGVMVLSLFHHSTELEANAYEAGMIDAIGLNKLTNIKKGSYKNTPASKWIQKKRNQFGAVLLHKSYTCFVVTDCKSFFPKDV